MTRRTPQRGAKVPETQDPAYYEALGRAIKVARTELGLSRKELAARAKISYPYIADIESGRGRPSSGALLAVAGALGMSPSTLMAMGESFVQRMQEPSTDADAPMVAPAGSSGSWFRGDVPRMARMSSPAPDMEEPAPARYKRTAPTKCRRTGGTPPPDRRVAGPGSPARPGSRATVALTEPSRPR